MPLFARFTFKITLILFIHRSDGFMFNPWFRSNTEQRSTTESTFSTFGQYEYQNHANNDARFAAATSNRYESKKDSARQTNVAAMVVTPHSHAPASDKDTIATYNNQRTGISPPPKYDKPWNVFDAVVVHSIPSAAMIPSTPISYVAIPAHNYPYLYYRDEIRAQPVQNIAPFRTTLMPQKSVQVELNYKDDAVAQKIGENVALHRKIPTISAESIQPTADEPTAPVTNIPTTTLALVNTSFSPSSSFVSVQQQNPTTSTVIESSSSSSSASASASASATKPNYLPSRPIKLVASNPFYVPVNFSFTSPPQLYYPPAAPADVQYVPYHFLKSPLVTPFLYKNVPRAVSERSEILPQLPASPPSPVPQLTNNIKPEKSICENCILPPTFPTIFPQAFKIFDTNEHTFQKPCVQDGVSNQATSSTSESPNLAYILVQQPSSQIIKNRVL